MRPIVLEIDSLVVEGLGPSEARDFAAALEGELETRLEGVPASGPRLAAAVEAAAGAVAARRGKGGSDG
jgi:hypothetical protein